MSDRHGLLQLCKTIILVLTLGVSMSPYGFGGDSWKEEVLLHDGSKMIVERSQSYGARGLAFKASLALDRSEGSIEILQ